MAKVKATRKAAVQPDTARECLKIAIENLEVASGALESGYMDKESRKLDKLTNALDDLYWDLNQTAACI
jgi:hypothetical protein